MLKIRCSLSLSLTLYFDLFLRSVEAFACVLH